MCLAHCFYSAEEWWLSPTNVFCSRSKLGFKAAVDAWSEIADLDGLVVFTCSIVCQPVALLAAAWNIPIVSYLCSSSLLSDKEVYPTFTRTAVNWVAVFPGVFAATIHAFGSVTPFAIHLSRPLLTHVFFLQLDRPGRNYHYNRRSLYDHRYPH